MFFNKRGQAAMEFLMTYGWAILVVLAAVGILAYLGVFNMQERVPSVCELNPTGQGLDCSTSPFFDSGDNVIEFTIVNGNPWDAENITITTSESGCEFTDDTEGYVGETGSDDTPGIDILPRGESRVVSVSCDFEITSGESYNEQFSITYLDENEQRHRNNAHISGTA